MIAPMALVGGTFMRQVMVAAVAMLLVACAPKPERACIKPGVDAVVTDLIYQKVSASIEGTSWPEPIDRRTLQQEVASLRQANFFTLDPAILEGFDKTTKRVTCRTFIRYHVTQGDRSESNRDLIDMLDLDGLTPPEELYLSSPRTVFEFKSQPTSDGKETFVSIEDADEPVSAVVKVAINRILARRMRGPTVADEVAASPK